MWPFYKNNKPLRTSPEDYPEPKRSKLIAERDSIIAWDKHVEEVRYSDFKIFMERYLKEKKNGL